MDPLLELARKYELVVIEDAAESIGASYKEKNVGTIGDIAENLYIDALSLPCSVGMASDLQRYVIEAINDLLCGHRGKL